MHTIKRLLIGSILVLPLALSVSSVSAASSPKVAAAYAKGNDVYDVVVQGTPGTVMDMYVNEKSPTLATVNRKGWATFRKVPLASTTGKLSFTQVLKGAHGKQYQKRFGYVRTYTVSSRRVSFSAPVTKPVAASPAPVSTPTPPAAPVSTAPAPNTGTTDTNLSNNNTYVNSTGATVHSPAASTDGSVPAGATAQCNDGTYSFSQHHSGTCSGHHGVSRWL